MNHIPSDAATTAISQRVYQSFRPFTAASPSESNAEFFARIDAWSEHPDAIVDEVICRLHPATAGMGGDHPLRFLWHLWRAHRANRKFAAASRSRNVRTALQSYERHLMAMDHLTPRCEHPEDFDPFEETNACDARRHHGEGKL